MLKRERQTYILQQVNLHNRILSSSLSVDIQVSEDTVRRDLQELAEEGKLIKVHGGALSRSFNQLHVATDDVYSQAHKVTIARKAISLIRQDMFVLTGGGTTIVEMARMLPPDLRATFISGSIAAILEYIEHPLIEVVLIGDRISKSSKITVGPEAIAKIRQLRADICFLGINSIDATGVSDNDWEVVQLKQAMIESSRIVVCMAISEKINSFQPIRICDLSRIDVLITELDPGDPLLKTYADAGVRII